MSGTSIVFQGSTDGRAPMTAYLHSKDGHLLTKVTENSNPLTSHVRWSMKDGISIGDTVATQVQPVSCNIPAASYRINDSNRTLHMRFTLAPWCQPDGSTVKVAFPVTIPAGTYPDIGTDGTGTAYSPDDEGLCAVLAQNIANAYELLAQVKLPSGGVPSPFVYTLEGTTVGATGLFSANITADPEPLNTPFTTGRGFGMLLVSNPSVDPGLTSVQSFMKPTLGTPTTNTDSHGRVTLTQTATTAPVTFGVPVATYLDSTGTVGYYTPADIARGCKAEGSTVVPNDFHVIMHWDGPLMDGTQKFHFSAVSVPGSTPEVNPTAISGAPNEIYLVDPGFHARAAADDPLQKNEMYWEPLVCETTLDWFVYLHDTDIPPTNNAETHPMFSINVTTIKHPNLQAPPSERGIALAFQQLTTFTAHAFPQANTSVTDPENPFDQPIPTNWVGNDKSTVEPLTGGFDRLGAPSITPGGLDNEAAEWISKAASNYDVCPLYFTGSNQTERVFTWIVDETPLSSGNSTRCSMGRLDMGSFDPKAGHDAGDYNDPAWVEWQTPEVQENYAGHVVTQTPRYNFPWLVLSIDDFWTYHLPAPSDITKPNFFPGPSYMSCAVSRIHCTEKEASSAPPIAQPSEAASALDYRLAYYVQYGKFPAPVPDSLTGGPAFPTTPLDDYSVSSSFMMPHFDKKEQKVRFNLFGKAKWRQFYGAKPLHYNAAVQWNRCRNGQTNVPVEKQELFGFADGADPAHPPGHGVMDQCTTMWGMNLTSCNITPYGMWSAHSTEMFETGVANSYPITGFDGGDRQFPANNVSGDPFELAGSGNKSIPWHLRRSYWAEYGTPSHTATDYPARAPVHGAQIPTGANPAPRVEQDAFNVNQQGWWSSGTTDAVSSIAEEWQQTPGETTVLPQGVIPKDDFYAFSPVDPDLHTMPRQGFIDSDYTDDKMCTFPFVKVELLNTKSGKYTDYITKQVIDPADSNILDVLGFGKNKDVIVDLEPILAAGTTKVQVGAMLPAARAASRSWPLDMSSGAEGQDPLGTFALTSNPCSTLTFTGTSGATEEPIAPSPVATVLSSDPSPQNPRSTIRVPGTVFNYPPVSGGIGGKRMSTGYNQPGKMDMQDVRYCGGWAGGTVFPDPMAPDVMRGRPYAPVMPTCYWRGYVKPKGDLVKECAKYTDEISDSDVVVCDVVAPAAPSVGQERQQIYIAMEAANGTSLASISDPSKLIVNTGIIGTARLLKGDRYYYEIEDVRHPCMYKAISLDNITLSLLDENLDYLDLQGENWSIALAFTFIPITPPPMQHVPQFAQQLLGHPITPMSQRIQQAYSNLMLAQQQWEQNVAQLKRKKKRKNRRNAPVPPTTAPLLAAKEGAGEPRGLNL